MEIVDLPAGHPGWGSALPVLAQLRAHLSAEALADVLADDGAQRPQFLGVFEGDRCLGVAGWRVLANTVNGRQLYVDDLVTDETSRSSGVGAVMIARLRELARAHGCAAVHLDSGVHRFGAHRFYLRERFDITSHHFVLDP